MTRRFSLRRFLKPATLAFAISMIIVPAAAAQPVIEDGGSVATIPTTAPFVNYGPYDGWYTRATEGPALSGAGVAAADLGPVDGWYNRATESPIVSPDDRSLPRSTPITQAPVQVASRTDGFNWGHAGFGAAGILALALFAGMGLLALRQRPVTLSHG
jgi:hypothetical protein